jgi:allantoin racemase
MLAMGCCSAMAVYLINPNSTRIMTENALHAAQTAAPDLEFIGWTSQDGPTVIEGPEDGAASIPPLLTLVQKASDAGADAIIIACFDDTGLKKAKEIARCPVIGIGQASYHMASLLAEKSAVITTVEAAVPILQNNISAIGLADHIPVVKAANIGVAELDTDTEKALQKFNATAQSIQLAAHINTFILGCAGAVQISSDFALTAGVTAIEPVSAAARLCRAISTRL